MAGAGAGAAAAPQTPGPPPILVIDPNYTEKHRKKTNTKAGAAACTGAPLVTRTTAHSPNDKCRDYQPHIEDGETVTVDPAPPLTGSDPYERDRAAVIFSHEAARLFQTYTFYESTRQKMNENGRNPQTPAWAGMTQEQKKELQRDWENYLTILLTDKNFHEYLRKQYPPSTPTALSPTWEEHNRAVKEIGALAGHLYSSLLDLRTETGCPINLPVDIY